jgi:hypothetical protein
LAQKASLRSLIRKYHAKKKRRMRKNKPTSLLLTPIYPFYVSWTKKIPQITGFWLKIGFSTQKKGCLGFFFPGIDGF